MGLDACQAIRLSVGLPSRTDSFELLLTTSTVNPPAIHQQRKTDGEAELHGERLVNSCETEPASQFNDSLKPARRILNNTNTNQETIQNPSRNCAILV